MVGTDLTTVLAVLGASVAGGGQAGAKGRAAITDTAVHVVMLALGENFNH